MIFSFLFANCPPQQVVGLVANEDTDTLRGADFADSGAWLLVDSYPLRRTLWQRYRQEVINCVLQQLERLVCQVDSTVLRDTDSNHSLRECCPANDRACRHIGNGRVGALRDGGSQVCALLCPVRDSRYSVGGALREERQLVSGAEVGVLEYRMRGVWYMDRQFLCIDRLVLIA